MSKRYKLRHFARRRVVQVLYQCHLLGEYQNDIEALDQPPADIEYFDHLIKGIFQKKKDIDATLSPTLDRPIAELTPIELAVLRLGVYELLYEKDLPNKVAINEAIELAKTFGAADGFKYVNGVLDKINRALVK